MKWLVYCRLLVNVLNTIDRSWDIARIYMQQKKLHPVALCYLRQEVMFLPRVCFVCLIELISLIMQIFNIHKQAEFTKINGHVSPIVYRIERSSTKRHATLIFA